MHRRPQHPLIVTACAAALVSVEVGVARAGIQPFIYVQVLASTSPTGPYTSALSDLSAGSIVYFRVTDVLAPIGSANGNSTINTESSSDGLNKMEYLLTATGGATFNSAALAAAPINFTQGLGEKPYSALTPTTLTDGEPVAAIGVYDGAIASGPLDVVETGNMTFNTNASIAATYGGSGAISYNNGANHQAVASTFFSYGNPLLLSSASTEAWSGQTGASWTGSSNFSGATYTDGGVTPVSFGDSVSASTVTIPASGITPFSVTFNNASTTYSFTAADATGIAGTAPVTLDGAGTVKFTSANTYSGVTTINAGTLRANNGSSGSATGTGNIYVTGGTLGGNGTVSGTVDLSSGAITAGADATQAGTLSTGAETWNSGTSYIWKLNDLSANGSGTAGANWDLIKMAALYVPPSPGSVITVNMKSYGGSIPTAGVTAANLGSGTYEIASVTSTDIPGVTTSSTTPVILTGANGVDNAIFALNTSGFANDPGASTDGSVYLAFIGTGTGTAGTLDLVYAGAPEPATAVLGLSAITPMLLSRRRRAGGQVC